MSFNYLSPDGNAPTSREISESVEKIDEWITGVLVDEDQSNVLVSVRIVGTKQFGVIEVGEIQYETGFPYSSLLYSLDYVFKYINEDLRSIVRAHYKNVEFSETSYSRI